jgi:hypothetical protein
MIKSKFRLWAFLPPVLVLMVSFLLGLIVAVSFQPKVDISSFVAFFVVLLFVFILLWLVLGELRTKEIKVTIDGDQIKVRNFLGAGMTKFYRFNEVDGFKTSILEARQGDYEYLYLIKNNRKVVKLSEFYHRNYKELKQVITAKTTDQGFEKFSYRREFREIFT